MVYHQCCVLIGWATSRLLLVFNVMVLISTKMIGPVFYWGFYPAVGTIYSTKNIRQSRPQLKTFFCSYNLFLGFGKPDNTNPLIPRERQQHLYCLKYCRSTKIEVRTYSIVGAPMCQSVKTKIKGSIFSVDVQFLTLMSCLVRCGRSLSRKSSNVLLSSRSCPRKNVPGTFGSLSCISNQDSWGGGRDQWYGCCFRRRRPWDFSVDHDLRIPINQPSPGLESVHLIHATKE